MSTDNITLKDLAARLGVSTTTVHRALNGKPGISDSLREEIRQIAAEAGYQTNLAAAALKRKAMRIGVLLPEPSLDNRFYCAAMWEGIHRFMQESGNLNIRLIEYHYPLSSSCHGTWMRDIYERHRTDIDGLITLGVNDSQSSYFAEKLHAAGISIVVVGVDLYSGSRLCCIKTYDQVAGSLAAELITAFLPSDLSGSILLTGNPLGASGMLDQYHNLAGFQDYMAVHHPSITMPSAYCADIAQLEDLLLPYLEDSDREYPMAIYACSARHTVQMCRILSKRNLAHKIKLVGNDSFAESIQLLRDHVLTAVIDKKIPEQTYLAAKILSEFLLNKSYPERDLIQIRPEILLKSNLPFD